MSIERGQSFGSRTVHLGISVCLLGEGFVAFGGGFDSGLSRIPVGGADLAVLVGELESVEQTECLVDAAAHRQVVDGDLDPKSAKLSPGTRLQSCNAF